VRKTKRIEFLCARLADDIGDDHLAPFAVGPADDRDFAHAGVREQHLLHLARTCRFPLLMLVTMRGEWEEFNPWQVPMGSAVEPVMQMCEAEVLRAREPSEVAGLADRAVQLAFGEERIVALLLSQQLIGKKVWTK
jgi:sulfopyruvate decarboxylase TPP-binding subunit